VQDAETEITRIEQEISEIESEMASGNTTDNQIYERHGALHKQLDNAMSVWELATMELDELNESQQ
jgi:ATP-binding cassette subfamily F protein 3